MLSVLPKAAASRVTDSWRRRGDGSREGRASAAWLCRGDRWPLCMAGGRAHLCTEVARSERVATIALSILRRPTTKRGALGSLSAALCVGLVFGSADGCVVEASHAGPTVRPDEATAEFAAAAERVEVVAAPAEPSRERPPPWRPPAQPELPGVEGAGQLLARGQAEAALERLAALGKLDATPGEADLEPETREWFVAGAIAGRAFLARGDYRQAVLALEPLAASRRFAEELPADIVGLELARARIGWAKTGLEGPAADLQLRRAITELDALKRRKPDRVRAAMRASQGEAMAAVAGEGARGQKAAARKAS